MHDILICGGGVAGLSLALSLRRAFGEQLRIGLVDPVFGERESNVRTSALTAGSRNLLEAIGIWPSIAPRAQPILGMKITDSRRNDAVRPMFLAFEEPLDDGSPFAWMIQNADLVAVLEQAVADAGIDIFRSAVSRIKDQGRAIELILRDGQSRAARLVVGADGVQSRIRRACGIETVGRDYDRTAIVATLAHEEDHAGVAVQHFMPAGPFAMLPLTGRRSSIVWTEPNDEARSYLAMSDEDFVAEVDRRFGPSLGRFQLEARPAAFPLRVHIARRFTAHRVALIGDAAHLVHPLAGQGLNLGLRDVAALTGLLADPIRLGLDVGGASVLAAYERARYFDTVAMMAGTDGLHRLFANDSGPLRALRDLGLGVVNRLPRLKRTLVREAAGLAGDVPALLRGRLP
ncbi:MAG: 2-octaprenyl-6-methoxyphenyl hydroxylase [Hyphomicrobiales bacterium]|nr:2-octaprenyl-6-methoxyphenyl hydroxylase [Hyphomicrobiales bacterium]